ncbi:cbb3-type cytochrome oxidase assembly protein CcoS [Rapidithrix thailandica]|uniref:Cbb3-type cytochrome oxidase assembly protein CcoS n=1 Tax=Rapidithrix thailandica TaxID=413964 RepID=A0AAW9RNB5_9BACT
MSVIFILIGISLIVATCFLGAFIWSVKSNQYEDTYTPSIRILFEDDHKSTTTRSESTSERGA